jgi:hypothetical protein
LQDSVYGILLQFFYLKNIQKGLMSAPASLAIAKTLFPETKKTRADWNAIANIKAKYYLV